MRRGVAMVKGVCAKKSRTMYEAVGEEAMALFEMEKRAQGNSNLTKYGQGSVQVYQMRRRLLLHEIELIPMYGEVAPVARDNCNKRKALPPLLQASQSIKISYSEEGAQFKSKHSPPPSKGRKRSLSPDGSRSPVERSSPLPKERKEAAHNRSDYSGSPKRNDSRSSVSGERDGSPAAGGRYRSPEANGRSPRPRDYGDGENNHASKGSESPQD